MAKTCALTECHRPYYARTFCRRHYEKARAAGAIPPRPTVQERFWEKVNKSGDNPSRKAAPGRCWEWTGSATPAGYGQFWVDNVGLYAHRVAMEWDTGSRIAPGMEVDHLCHNPRCVRPGHLRVVPHAANMQNREGAASHSGSGVRGVGWVKRKKLWRVRGSVQGKEVTVGYFKSLEEAEARAIEWRRDNMPYSHMDAEATGVSQ